MNITFRGGSDDATAITTLKAVSDEIRLDGKGADLVFSVANTSANALTDFQIRAKVSADDTFARIIHGSEWATLNSHLKMVQGTLNTLAGGASGRAHVSIGSWYSIQFWASAGTAATTTIKYNVRCEG
jgi:hypothetical protein